MFTVFTRRRRRHHPNTNNPIISNKRAHVGALRAASLPPTRLQRQNGFSNGNLNILNNHHENTRIENCRHSQPRTIDLLYGELPWHVSHSDVYGVSAGIQQNYPEIQKMPIFGSVPALHQANSMNSDVNNNTFNQTSRRKPSDSSLSSTNKHDSGTSIANGNSIESYVGTLRYFNLRQPVNLAGSFDPKVIRHETRGDEDGHGNQSKSIEPRMIIQPLSLMPDWR